MMFRQATDDAIWLRILVFLNSVSLVCVLFVASSYAEQRYHISALVDWSTPIPQVSDTFKQALFDNISVGDGVVAFKAGRISQHTRQDLGVYLFDGVRFTRISHRSTRVSPARPHAEKVGSPMMAGRRVAFTAVHDDGVGIYILENGTITRVVDDDTPIPGGVGPFSKFVQLGFADGRLLFGGVGEAHQVGLYAFEKGRLRVIADRRTQIPNGSGTFTGFHNAPAVGGGLIAFLAAGPEQQGIYAHDGRALVSVADRNTKIPAGQGTFSTFSTPVVGNGLVAFTGVGAAGQLGIYVYADGTLKRVADLATAIPGGSGNFSEFSPELLAHHRTVAFLASGTRDQSGLYLYDAHGLRRVVDKSTPVPHGPGRFTDFMSPVLSSNQIAFIGQSPNHFGIYVLRDGALSRVVDQNTSIPGGPGKFDRFTTLSMSGEQITFKGLGTGTRIGLDHWEGIYAARPLTTGR